MDCGLGSTFDCGFLPAGAFDTMESGGGEAEAGMETEPMEFNLEAAGVSPINSEGTPSGDGSRKGAEASGGSSSKARASSLYASRRAETWE